MVLGGELLIGLAILIGLLGIVIPVLPGGIIVAIAIFVWALIVGGGAWWFFAAALLLIVVGEVTKYLVAGRKLRSDGVPNTSIIVGGVLGIVGFFVIPVIGLFIGFVLGAFLAELVRNRHPQPAWRGAVSATKAAVWTIGIELLAALLATAVWISGAITY